MVVTVTETRDTYRHTVVSTGAGSTCGGAPSFETGSGTQWLVEAVQTVTTTCEILPMTGTVELPELGTVTVYAGSGGGSICTDDVTASRVIEPVTDDAFILAIELVDYAGE